MVFAKSFDLLPFCDVNIRNFNFLIIPSSLLDFLRPHDYYYFFTTCFQVLYFVSFVSNVYFLPAALSVQLCLEK